MTPRNASVSILLILHVATMKLKAVLFSLNGMFMQTCCCRNGDSFYQQQHVYIRAVHSWTGPRAPLRTILANLCRPSTMIMKCMCCCSSPCQICMPSLESSAAVTTAMRWQYQSRTSHGEHSPLTRPPATSHFPPQAQAAKLAI